MTLGVPNGPQALSIAHDHTSCSLIRVAKTPICTKLAFNITQGTHYKSL